MEEKVKQIFESNRMIMQQINCAVLEFNRQSYEEALEKSIQVVNSLTSLFGQIQEVRDDINETGVVQIIQKVMGKLLTELFNTQENGDFIKLCDLYTLEVLPFLQNVQKALLILMKDIAFQKENWDEVYEKIVLYDKKLANLLLEESKDKLNRDEYITEYCLTGTITLGKVVDGHMNYYHSRYKPVKSAAMLAQSWYKTDKIKYIVYGFGLGYHAMELGKIDELLEIVVYEKDINVLRMAAVYGVLEAFLQNPKHHVIYDKHLQKIHQDMKKINIDTQLVIHFPSLQVLEEDNRKKSLENYFIRYGALQNQYHKMQGNYRENIKNVREYIHALQDEWRDKTIYIVGAGPSLDKNIYELRNVGENSIIIASGIIFRKLIKEKILVDYVLVSESGKKTEGYFQGVEDQETPLLILPTTYYQCALKYKGAKYLIDYNETDRLNGMMKRKKTFFYETSHNDIMVALEICAQMKVKEVVMVGLDLAYTDNFMHARDVSRRYISDTRYLHLSKDVFGKEVYTTQVLEQYRKWIQNWIIQHKKIIFYNATEGGLNIEGMLNVSLKEIVLKKGKRDNYEYI